MSLLLKGKREFFVSVVSHPGDKAGHSSFRTIEETEGSVLFNDTLNYVYIASLVDDSNTNLKQLECPSDH
jgi:hypothetical protein